MKTKSYLTQVLLAIFIFGLIYLIIWIIFVINGPLKIGEDLNKSDWLIFLGGYLSFVGTISVTYVVIRQNREYHRIEQDKLRYSQLPYFRNMLTDKTKLETDNNHNYLINFLLAFENNKFIWKGDDAGLKIPMNQNDLGIYEIKNIGLGHAMKISLKTNESESFYKGHLKIEDSLYFTVDIGSLKKESQKFEFYLIFFDIYNNHYKQKFVCEFNISGTIFSFTTSIDQFEPEFLK